MSEINKETLNSIRTLCRKLSFDYPRTQWNGDGPYIVGVVPSDITIDRTKGEHLLLFGGFYESYLEAEGKLRKEKLLEYMEDRDLDDSLWRLACEMTAKTSIYRNARELNQKIDEFLSSILRPLTCYEVLVPVLNLDMGLELKIGDAVVKGIDQEELKSWGLPREHPWFEKLVNKMAVIISEKGNNMKMVCERARRKADFIMRMLQASLSMGHIEEQTLYKQGKHLIYRESGTPPKCGCQWQRGHEPISMKIDEKAKKEVEEFLGKIPEILDETLPPQLLDRFRIAVTWIGRTIDEEDPNIKVMYLSIALEALLTTQSDERKGEALASRMLLLNSHVHRPFIHPAQVLWIYELRSKVIHGSVLAIASQREYYTMRYVVLNTLVYSLQVIRDEALKSQTEFIKALESRKDIDRIVRWLESQGDERSLRIKEYIEKSARIS